MPISSTDICFEPDPCFCFCCGDGVSGLKGFVDVADRPYNDMVEASKATFLRLFDVHSGKEPPSAERPGCNEKIYKTRIISGRI